MPKTIIDEEIYNIAKSSLLKLKVRGTTYTKLSAIISSYKHGINNVAKIFNSNPSSIYRWAIKLRNEGLQSIINESKHQDGILLKEEHKKAISTWLKDNPNITINQVKERLVKEFELSVSKSTVHRAICWFFIHNPKKTAL